MTEEAGLPGNAEIIGTFLLLVRGIRWPDGTVSTEVQFKSEGIPREVVLMNVKAWLTNKERDYYHWFESKFDNALQ